MNGNELGVRLIGNLKTKGGGGEKARPYRRFA